VEALHRLLPNRVQVTNREGHPHDLSGISGVADHGGLTGLGDNDHPEYLRLAGQAGGQTARGGTAASENLRLRSTAHATKGTIYSEGALRHILSTFLNLEAGGAVTLASDTFTPTKSGVYTLSPEGGGASDSLTAIGGGAADDLVMISAAVGKTINVLGNGTTFAVGRAGTGVAVLSTPFQTMTFRCIASGVWYQVSQSFFPADAFFLVSTAHDELDNEIVVGPTPGGELGGTWASPTVDSIHGPEGMAHPAAGASQAHTVNTGLWNSQAGTARQVPVWNGSAWVPGFLNAIDVLEPPSVTGFTVQPAAAGYPDDTSGLAMVASSGTDTPRFAATYQGTPTAATIDIQSETYAGNPEVNPSDYPTTVLTPFTSHDGPAINRGAAVAEAVTFRITATVDSVSKTRDVTLTYVNERLWGISTVDDIDTAAEIDTFRTAQSKELSNSRAKTFSVTAGAGEYIYYIIRDALGTPTFTIGGFEGGFSKVGDNVSWTNPRGFVENYDVWRSDNANLGTTTVVVS